MTNFDIIVSRPYQHRLDFEWQGFKPSLEQAVRTMENVGRALAGVPPIKETFKLKKAWGWFHGKTGLTCQFCWEDEDTKEEVRQAFVHLDAPTVTGEVESFTTTVKNLFGERIGFKLLEMRDYNDSTSIN
jgi:hypothetical protein